MKIQFLFCLVLAFSLAMVRADDYEESYSEDKIEQSDSTYKDDLSNEKTEQIEQTQSDFETAPKAPEPAKKIVEDAETETTSLVENDAEDKHRKLGYCHWGIAVWFKPGYQIRCSCMKCTCAKGGNWNCAYYFPYCPYYYCGNQIYNPLTQVCCCGKVYTKNSNYNCCGYFYYDRRHSKCCNYYSVKSKKVNCPRFRI